MVVAVPGMRVMQVTADEIIDMVAVRHCLVPATRSMRVRIGMCAAGVSRRAGSRIPAVDGDDMFVVMAVVRRMQMTIMQIIDMVAVTDGSVTAAGGVHVAVAGVSFVGHVVSP